MASALDCDGARRSSDGTRGRLRDHRQHDRAPRAYLRGTGDGSGLPFYLVPERFAPLGHRCHGNGFCAARTKRPPRRPYVFIGRLRRTRDFYAKQHFRFRVPMVRPGRYKVVIWCKPCGGSLILAGATGFGQTVTVLR